MTKERLQELQEQLFQLERRIRPLEWDANRHQINEFKKAELTKLKAEQATLSGQMKELEAAPTSSSDNS